MKTITNNTAYLLKEIINIKGNPCKKTFQKLVYLLEQKGLKLNYEYGLHFYGPYSKRLNTETMFLNSEGVIAYDYSGYSHLMSINNNEFKVESKNLTDEQKKKIRDLIIHFKEWSPAELELLSTALYAYNHLEDKTEDSVIQGVQKIKGSKYSKEKIQTSLKNFDYFNKSLFRYTA